MIEVLLVDDDKYLQEMYSSIFPIQNINIVAQAYDGIQAIDVYSSLETKPDIVLMDQRMPRMDGIAATKYLLDMDPEAKVIFLSADDSLKSIALNSGASMFLSKPVSMQNLIDSINDTVNL